MEIKEVNKAIEWNNFITEKVEEYTFLQAWEWGEINTNKNDRAWRLGLYEGKEMVGICQCFTITARRGKILFVPHGPLWKKNTSPNLQVIVDYLTDLARKEKCVGLRISPLIEAETDEAKEVIRLGFRRAPVIMHAEDTWLVDLKGSEEEVMQRMRKTTRNLVRRGERDGVVIKQSQDLKDVDILFDLQMEVVKRNNFVPFSKAYLRKEMEIFFETNRAALFLGSFEGKTYGAALIVFLGKFAYYYQSGSIECRAPVNYLLQWEVMKEAKKRGVEIYNMWGIAPNDNPNHPWRGLTLFKTGFGGSCKKYMPSQDLVLDNKYWLMNIIERIPKTIRQKFRV